MVNFPGRNGRRRRVLNEEVLSASSSHAVLRAFTDSDGPREAPRYSDAAGVEHHPQITDFVPRRYRSIGLLVLAGGLMASGLALLHYFAPSVAAGLGKIDVARLEVGEPGSLAGWVEAITLMVAAIACTIIYSLRRHRIDDIRGRYRVWLAAAAACVAMSANSVAAVHEVLAHSLAHVTGWTALRSGAIWWLVLGGVPAAWIFVRALVDTLECRLAASLLVAAVLCYVTSAGSYFKLVSAADPRIESLISNTAMLSGHWLVLVGVVSYARFVILDAQGLIAVRPRSVQKKKPRTAKRVASTHGAEQASTAAPTVLSAVGYSRPAANAHTTSNQWVDGSRRERDHYDDAEDDSADGDCKLTKSQRKQLRKLKARSRAA